MYAVTIEPLNSVFFLAADPGQGPWKVEQGVELDFPSNYDLWPEGSPPSEQLVCISTSDPRHFKVFKYARDVDPEEYRPTGLVFGGLYSRKSWDRFRKVLPTHLKIAGIPDEATPVAAGDSHREPGGES